MESDDWENRDFLGLLLGFAFCFVGFGLMTVRFIVFFSSSSPPLPLQYGGALLFVLGIISFIILESGKKYEQGKNRIRIKKIFLLMMFLMAIFSLIIFSQSYIII